MSDLKNTVEQFFKFRCAVGFSNEHTLVDPVKTASAIQKLRGQNFSKTFQSRFLSIPAFRGTETQEYLNQFWWSRSVLVHLINQALNQGMHAEKMHCSLSHTKEACIVFIGDDFAVGVDLELTERPINLQLASRISQADEKILNLTALQIWVIKEACFKAHAQNAGTTLPEYQVVEEKNQRGIVKFQGAGFGDFNFMVLQTNGYTIAFAGAVKN